MTLKTMTDHEPIATGLPMSLAQMQKFLQDHHGIPVVLRVQGETGVKCPCCGEIDHHDHGPRHLVAGCSKKARNKIGMVKEVSEDKPRSPRAAEH